MEGQGSVQLAEKPKAGGAGVGREVIRRVESIRTQESRETTQLKILVHFITCEQIQVLSRHQPPSSDH